MTRHILDLWLTNRCQFTCWFCPVVNEQVPKQDLTYENVRLALRNLPNLRFIKVSGGEPLLHGSFRKIHSLLKQVGAELHLFTNGLILRDYMDILGDYAKIYVSLHSIRDFKKIFGADQSKKVLSSISMLPRKIREKLILSVGLLGQQNLDDVFAFADQVNVEAVNFFPIRAYSHGFSLNKPIKTVHHELFVSKDYKTKTYPCDHVLSRMNKTSRIPCKSPMETLVLTSSGQVRLCCGDQPSIGHIRDYPTILSGVVAKQIESDAYYRVGHCASCVAGYDFCVKCLWKEPLRKIWGILA